MKLESAQKFLDAITLIASATLSMPTSGSKQHQEWIIFDYNYDTMHITAGAERKRMFRTHVNYRQQPYEEERAPTGRFAIHERWLNTLILFMNEAVHYQEYDEKVDFYIEDQRADGAICFWLDSEEYEWYNKEYPDHLLCIPIVYEEYPDVSNIFKKEDGLNEITIERKELMDIQDTIRAAGDKVLHPNITLSDNPHIGSEGLGAESIGIYTGGEQKVTDDYPLRINYKLFQPIINATKGDLSFMWGNVCEMIQHDRIHIRDSEKNEFVLWDFYDPFDNKRFPKDADYKYE